ncbi:MAG: hypothetical protein P1U67_05025 [Alcanivoracaceae bacterium]|nr:hypothetical protein [Alcanivoracaceae bacterium]
MLTVTQQGDVIFVEFSAGSSVDVAMEQKLYRMRKRLFDQQGQTKQKVLYFGEIDDLNMSAAKFSCSELYAEITEAKVLVVASNINFTRAKLTVGLHKPNFPVYITDSISEGLTWLGEESWMQDTILENETTQHGPE